MQKLLIFWAFRVSDQHRSTHTWMCAAGFYRRHAEPEEDGVSRLFLLSALAPHPCGAVFPATAPAVADGVCVTQLLCGRLS